MRAGRGPHTRPRAAIAPLALAALTGLLLYAGIAVVGAARAPRQPAPLVRTTASGWTVVDGEIAYRVLDIARSRSVLDRLYPAGRAQAYVVVRVWLRNLSSRRGRSIRRTTFMLTDSAGDTTYQWPCWVPVSIDTRGQASAGDRRGTGGGTRAAAGIATRAQPEQPTCPVLHARHVVDPAVALSALYHLSPPWFPVPPRAAVQRVLVFVVPAAARRVVLLGPGVVATYLTVSAARAPVAALTSVARGGARAGRARARRSSTGWRGDGVACRAVGDGGAAVPG